MLPNLTATSKRKAALVDLGAWALSTGRVHLMARVTLTIQEEGLIHA